MINQEQLVEIQVLYRQGYSIRRIARELNISRNTVRYYLRTKASVPNYSKREPVSTKLSPYEAYLFGRIEAAKPHWIPATVLLREIKVLGYEGGVTMLKEHIKQYKPAPNYDPVVRFETEPGQQMQVDFTTISHHGKRIKAFAATLGSLLSSLSESVKKTGFRGLNKHLNSSQVYPKRYYSITQKPS